MKGIRTYERHEADVEKHEGEGTGLDLTVESVLAEALAVVAPPEPYEELHEGRGTGVDLDVDDVMGEVEEILKAGEMIEEVEAYLASYWTGTAETAEEIEEATES